MDYGLGWNTVEIRFVYLTGTELFSVSQDDFPMMQTLPTID